MIEGLNTVTMGIEDSLSTDTTELSSTNVKHKKQRRSKFNQFHRELVKKKPRSRISNMGDTGAPQETGENNQFQDQDQNQGDTQAMPPTEEMYLPDLNNTPLSQALKNELDYGLEDEVMVECTKLKQYFRVDTFLVQRISGWIRLYTNNKVETFPISCSRTKFPPSLMDKALREAEK